MWLKESKRLGKVFYSEKQLQDSKKMVEILMYKDFGIEDKENLLKSFLGHTYVLSKLKQVIQDDISTQAN